MLFRTFIIGASATALVVGSLSPASVILIPRVEAATAPNCEYTAPLITRSAKSRRAYEARNPKDCWDHSNGICLKDRCGPGEGQALDKLVDSVVQDLTKQLMDKLKQALSGGGGGGGGGGGSSSSQAPLTVGGIEIPSNLTPEQQQAYLEQAIREQYYGDVDIFDYFTPTNNETNQNNNQNNTDNTNNTSTEDDDSDATTDPYSKPGALPQEYYCPGGNCDGSVVASNQSTSNQSDDDDNSSSGSDDDNNQTNTTSTQNNNTNTSNQNDTTTANNQPANEQSQSAPVTRTGVIGTVSNFVDKTIQYLKPGSKDRIIYNDQETANIDLTYRGGATEIWIDANGDVVQYQPGTDTYAQVGYTPEVPGGSWQVVQTSDGEITLLTNGLLWFLVSPTHGLAASISELIRTSLSRQ